MSSRLLIRQLSEQYMTANFTAKPVKFENTVFTQPQDGEWVEFFVETARTKPRTIGRGLTRTHGQLRIVVRFPVGEGMGDGWVVADQVGTLFDSLTLPYQGSYLKFKCASASSGGRIDSSYSIVVTVPFEFDGDDR